MNPFGGLLFWDYCVILALEQTVGAALYLAGGLGVGLAAAAIFVFHRLFARPRSLPISVDWINDLSASRYRPMERLLDGEDYRFLASQLGYDKKMLRRMRSERRRLFRAYLANLRSDFQLASRALRLLMTYSTRDRADLARNLYKQQMLFTLGMLRLQWSLALHACGIGSVNAKGLLHITEYVRTELRQLIPVESPVAA
jgi:hypothetical protein